MENIGLSLIKSLPTAKLLSRLQLGKPIGIVAWGEPHIVIKIKDIPQLLRVRNLNGPLRDVPAGIEAAYQFSNSLELMKWATTELEKFYTEVEDLVR